MAYHKFKRLNILTLVVLATVFIAYTIFINPSSGYSNSNNKLSGSNPINEKNLDKSLIVKETDIIEESSDLELDIGTEPKPLKGSQKKEAEAKAEKEPKSFDLNDTDIAFMPKMTNETLKAELGNAAWKLFHTILARYPVSPSTEQESHLSNYINFFAKVYPCGDCARHFQKLLAKYPPQLSSRSNAAVWGCHIHNKVNERLKKPIYDCNNIIEDYDCGCGDDEVADDFTLNGQAIKDSELTDHLEKIELDSVEGKQLGG